MFSCYVIYSCRWKPLNSRSQMFFKTRVLKNFAVFTGKHLCWSLFLVKSQDWRLAFCIFTPTQVFSRECCKIFKSSFFTEHLLRNFMWWWILNIWRLYFAIAKLGHISERTSQQIDQNFLWRDIFFYTKISFKGFFTI